MSTEPAAGHHARAGVERLALGQATALMWAEGAPLEAERLTLWGASRIGCAAEEEEEEGMAHAAWVARRLATGCGSLASPASLARFGGRRLRIDGAGADGAEEAGSACAAPWKAFARARGAAWTASAEAWAAEVRSLRAAHRFTQGCVAARARRLSGLSDATAAVEPAVVAMTIAARAGRGAAPFAPLARRRTPDADADAGAVSVSAAQRNLARLADQGLSREITGRGRFRMWSASI